MDFKLGDVVQLKSGGLYMTVFCLNWELASDVERVNSVDVVYFDNDAVFRTEELIPVQCLSKKEEE